MKKKIFLVLLVLIIGLSTTGCGNSYASKDATVINREGKKETLTSKEICSVYDENDAKFKKYYAGAEISFIGTVSEVDSYFRENGDSRLWDAISFKEGFRVYLPYEEYDIADLSKGDVLYVKSNIYSGFDCGTLDLRGTGGSEGYSTESLKTTVIKNTKDMSEKQIKDLKNN